MNECLSFAVALINAVADIFSSGPLLYLFGCLIGLVVMRIILSPLAIILRKEGR